MHSTGTSYGIRTGSIPGVSSSFGERLQRYRNRLNISGEELASRINEEYGARTISRSIVANIENNRRKVTKFDEIIQLSHGLRITPLALICDLEQPLLPADNPVFKGLTNMKVAERFLADVAIPLPPPQEILQPIFSAYREYVASTDALRERLTKFNQAVRGIASDDPLRSEDEDLFGALALEADCKKSITDVATASKKLEVLDVVIPVSLKEEYEQACEQVARISKQARENGVITPDMEHERQKWISDQFSDSF